MTIHVWRNAHLTERGNYPDTFSFDELKSLRTFKARVAYARERLPLLGKGSSRIVFDAGTAVLKVAWNKKGLAQNQIEADVGSDGYALDYVAEVFDFTNDYIFLEQEKAVRRPTEKEMERLFNAPYNEGLKALRALVSYREGDTRYWVYGDKEKKIIGNSPYLQGLADLCSTYDLLPGDFRIENMGVVLRDGEEAIVLVDVGFNRAVSRDYYHPKRK